MVVELDEGHIASGICRLAGMDRSTLRELGARARPLVERELAWTTIAEKLHAAYTSYCVCTSRPAA